MNHFQKSSKKLERLRSIFFQLGLIVSCSLTFLAFEWKTVYSIPELSGGLVIDIYEEPYPTLIPREEKITPPEIKLIPIQPQMDIFEPVPDDTPDPVLVEEVKPSIPVDFNPDDWNPIEKVPDDEIDIPVSITGQMPEFIGGEGAMLKYLGENLEYPRAAIEYDIEGTVHLEFVVGKNGKIRDLKIKKGVNELLDKEALRVVRSMPDWIPGKQHGKKVSVIYNLPIRFKLNG